MSDVAIIGSKDIVKVFELLGVTAYPAGNASEAKVILERLINESPHKVLFVLENLANEMRDLMQKATALDDMTVVPLPEHLSEVSFLDDEIRRLSKEAIGMEI